MAQGNRQDREHPHAGLYHKTKALLGTSRFFYIVIALFVLQAGYIAIRSGFPLAFDEGYHLGIIQLYAHQWSPYFAHLPAATAQFGALATDPSYLYHYLMSFPYRFIQLFTHSTFATILFLRFINIGFFVGGIVLFRKVLAYTGASRALINLVILAFSLLPLETFTAAQINYDTLQFPIVAGALLLTLQFTGALKRGQFDLKRLVALVSVCLLGAQVKYVLLPLFVGIMLFLSFMVYRQIAKHSLKTVLRSVLKDWRQISKRAKFLLLAVLMLSLGTFSWRFGYNQVRYGALVPDCSKVISVQACRTYGVWEKSYELSLQHVPKVTVHQFIAFNKVWVHIMGDELLTVLNASKGGAMENPVRQLVITGVVLSLCGVVLIARQWRRFVSVGYPMGLFLVVNVAYLGALWLKNYADYTRYGIPIAIQGRYLLPVLLLLMIVVAQAYSLSLHKMPHWKFYLMVAALVMGVQGGGVITYVRRTDISWYWSPSAATSIVSPAVSQNGVVRSQPPNL